MENTMYGLCTKEILSVCHSLNIREKLRLREYAGISARAMV